jgi:hypothetical protein
MKCVTLITPLSRSHLFGIYIWSEPEMNKDETLAFIDKPS